MAAVFGMWATFRVAVLQLVRSDHHYDDRWRAVITDFEIHTLDPHFGWDLAAVPLLAGVAVLFLGRQSSPIRAVAFANTTVVATLLALGMALFPSAALGGYIDTAPTTFIGQSVAFALGGLVVLILTAIAFRAIGRRRAPDRE